MFVTTTLVVIIFTVFIQVEYSYLVKWIFFLWSLVTHCDCLTLSYSIMQFRI
jgi:hypothetical protein